MIGRMPAHTTSLRAGRREVKREGKSGYAHPRPVVRRNEEGRRLLGAGATDGYLLRSELDAVRFRDADDGVAKIFIRIRGSQSDGGSDLRGEVVQVLFHLNVGEFQRSDLPRGDDGQEQDGASSDDEWFFD